MSHRQNSLRYSDSNLHTYVTVKSLKCFVGDSAGTPKGKSFGVANMINMKEFAYSWDFLPFDALSQRMRNGHKFLKLRDKLKALKLADTNSRQSSSVPSSDLD